VVTYSIKSSERIFHLPHCKIGQRIRKEYRQQFFTQEEARVSGYRACNCCSQMGMKLRREQKAVGQFCQENGVSVYLEDGQLHVLTPYSKWRIIENGKANKLFLYHKNKFSKPEKRPSIVLGYHSQAARSSTIVGYLKYIVEHDEYWRRERERNKKKATSKQELRRSTRSFQRGATYRSYSANQLYSILNNLDL